MSSRPSPTPQFKLHNNDGIPFPPIEALFAEGELFFDRFRALTPKGEKDSVIGEGGTGLIHLVRDELMDRIVALKLPHDLILRDKSARSDVIRETRQAIELTHPNIVRIHDFHEGKEGWGISMQYVRGRNLDEWRHEGQLTSRHTITPYPVERIEDWIRQLLEALSYAHEDAHMVHRDIKPKNLMLERHPDGREKLLLTDFGITQKLRLHTMMLSRTQPGQTEQNTMGTLPYMPWEQIQGGAPSVLDDVYAVGATIYELVTGRPPFYEGGYEQIRMQVETVVPPPMAERLAQFDLPNHGIPRQWEETVAACLAKRPSDRPQSARDIAARLGLVDAPAVLTMPDPEVVNRLEGEVIRLRRELDATRSRMQELESQLASERTTQAGSDETTARLESTITGLRTELAQAAAEARRWKESYENFQGDLEGEHEQLIQNLKNEISAKEALLAKELKASKQSQERVAGLEKELADAAGRTSHLQKEIEELHQQAREKEKDLSRRVSEADKAARAEMSVAVQQARQEVDAFSRKAQQIEADRQKLAVEHDKAVKKLRQADERASRQVMPLLIVLIASLLLGSTAGGIWGALSGGKADPVPALSLDSWAGRSIPTQPGRPGELVPAGLMREFLTAGGLPPAEHDRVVRGLSGLSDDEPVTAVNWWLAENFCGWLTSQSFSAGEIQEGLHFGIPTPEEISGERDPDDPPEWCAPGADDAQADRPAVARQVLGTRAGEEGWQIPSLGETLVSGDGIEPRGIALRVILRGVKTD